MGSQNTNVAASSWRYLSGQKLAASEMGLSGQASWQSIRATSSRSSTQLFAHIIEHECAGKKLLYLIDEVENFTKIKNKNTAARWQESIRALLDVKNVGIVLTVGAENMQGIPSVILMPDIVRRIQIDNYEAMAALKTATAEKFVRDLIGVVINPACRSEREKQHGWTDGTNDYAASLYPFTRQHSISSVTTRQWIQRTQSQVRY